MPFTSSITGPCAITICKRQSSDWRKVTEHVISKGQTNKTFPNYVQLGDKQKFVSTYYFMNEIINNWRVLLSYSLLILINNLF